MSKWMMSTILGVLIVLGCVAGGAEPPATPREDTWIAVPDTDTWGGGHVSACVATPKTVYISGAFTYVGPNTGGGALIRLSTGTLVKPFPRVGGEVYSSVPDGYGGWYIAGEFDSVGDVPCLNIAHILADGTVDPQWYPGDVSVWGSKRIRGRVYGLALSDGVVYAGGWFTTIGGQARRNIAALDAATGLATAWDPCANDDVWSLAVSDGVVYAGGWFTTIGGQARNYIAALDARTGAATAWDPNPGGIGRTFGAWRYRTAWSTWEGTSLA